jgi:transcription initiation factor TFIIE subunit alpha
MVEEEESSQVKKSLDTQLIQILQEIGGEHCVHISGELYNIQDPEITDDELAEICGIKLNIVRKILYILYENKLSEFRKVRDRKSGWFIYYWHENFANVKELIRLKQEQVLEKLNARLEYEENNVFYKCEVPECAHVATFNEASDENFKCLKCGGMLNFFENMGIKEFLQEKIAILRQNIKNCF